MNRHDVCIVINSTPKYYYLLPFMVGMIKRYAPNLVWPIYLVTEDYNNPICIDLMIRYGVKLVKIDASKSGFLESRLAGIRELRNFRFCLPLQDDFILEMPMLGAEIEKVLQFLSENSGVASARLMPCPGPAGSEVALEGWAYLGKPTDSYGFVYQATLWRTDALEAWYTVICDYLEEFAPKAKTAAKYRTFVEITQNIAENGNGQAIFWEWSANNGLKHIAWVRKGTWPNAVYLSPFPYRPTAVVKGFLEKWAVELAKREGFPLEAP